MRIRKPSIIPMFWIRIHTDLCRIERPMMRSWILLKAVSEYQCCVRILKVNNENLLFGRKLLVAGALPVFLLDGPLELIIAGLRLN